MQHEVENYLALEQYTTPDIEVIDIELTQNILQGSPNAPLPPIDDGGSAW